MNMNGMRTKETPMSNDQFQWQPIETAKRDEMRSVLLLTPEGMQIGWWSDRAANWLADDGKYLWADPTHWMPLPPAPEETT